MNIFQKITDFVKRDFSTFDMTNNWIGSIKDFGSLNKIYDSVVLPADRWKGGHNVIVKLPPLVAPAFTRIRGVINSFYVSYQSVWNYWNSFISNKPEDAFLTRGSLLAYNGKFVEPYVPMAFIALIAKLGKGYFTDFDISFNNSTNVVTVKFHPLSGAHTYDPDIFRSVLTWTESIRGRHVEITRVGTVTHSLSPLFPGPSSDNLSSYEYFTFEVPNWRSTCGNSSFVNSIDDLASLFGFSNLQSWFFYQVQSVCRNLENSGVPVDLMARSYYAVYKDDKFNLLNHICESFIWQEIYRDSQNQSPEFDYREVNGCLLNPGLFHYDSVYTSDSNPFGWYLKMNGLPPNVSMSSSDNGYYFRVDGSSESQVGRTFSVLTGFLLRQVVLQANSNLSSNAAAVNILPDYYNGLLCVKYRNFEKDYFTSASLDPLMGGIPVMVPTTIDALRTASKFEEFLERWTSARDFVSFMTSSYGEKPRETYVKPVFLGSQVLKVQIGEQLQTSESTSSSPLGERAGVADGYGSSGTINETFREHGYLCSYLSFILDSQYCDGMPHHYMHHLQFDYPWPDFANLGAEMIPTSEIYYGSPSVNLLDNSLGNSVAKVHSGDVTVSDSRVVSESVLDRQRFAVPGNGIFLSEPSSDLSRNGHYSVYGPNCGNYGELAVTPFGYTPRYSRWKFKTDVVSGQMRDEMDFWQTFRQFSNVPHIGNSFVSYMNAGFTSNLNRIFAVVNDNADKFYVDIFNNMSVRRCLPLVPSTSLN